MKNKTAIRKRHILQVDVTYKSQPGTDVNEGASQDKVQFVRVR